MALWSDSFKRYLAAGKYSHWATDITEEGLLGLFCAVNALGVAAVANEDDPLPMPRIEFGAENRVHFAIELLTKIYAGELIDWHMGSGWDLRFSDERSAFSEAMAATLKEHKDTAWAHDISERALALLLWMVGEYAIRYHGMEFPRGTSAAATMTSGLEAIHRVYKGELSDPAAVRSWIVQVTDSPDTRPSRDS